MAPQHRCPTARTARRPATRRPERRITAAQTLPHAERADPPAGPVRADSCETAGPRSGRRHPVARDSSERPFGAPQPSDATAASRTHNEPTARQGGRTGRLQGVTASGIVRKSPSALDRRLCAAGVLFRCATRFTQVIRFWHGRPLFCPAIAAETGAREPLAPDLLHGGARTGPACARCRAGRVCLPVHRSASAAACACWEAARPWVPMPLTAEDAAADHRRGCRRSSAGPADVDGSGPVPPPRRAAARAWAQ